MAFVNKWPTVCDEIMLLSDAKECKECISHTNVEIAPFLVLIKLFGMKKKFQEAANKLFLFSDVRLFGDFFSMLALTKESDSSSFILGFGQ